MDPIITHETLGISAAFLTFWREPMQGPQRALYVNKLCWFGFSAHLRPGMSCLHYQRKFFVIRSTDELSIYVISSCNYLHLTDPSHSIKILWTLQICRGQFMVIGKWVVVLWHDELCSVFDQRCVVLCTRLSIPQPFWVHFKFRVNHFHALSRMFLFTKNWLLESLWLWHVLPNPGSLSFFFFLNWAWGNRRQISVYVQFPATSVAFSRKCGLWRFLWTLPRCEACINITTHVQ